jgi:transposase
VLLPQLRPGDVVVLDNLSSHKRASTRASIESAGVTLLFLPPYSPDLNPIEMIFAKVKQALRSLACRARRVVGRDARRAGSHHRHRFGQLLPPLRIHATTGLKML